MKRVKKLALLVLTFVAIIAVWLHRRHGDRGPAAQPHEASALSASPARKVALPPQRAALFAPVEAGDARRIIALTPKPGGAVVRGRVIDVSGGIVVGASVVAHAFAQAAAPLGVTASDAEGAFELTVPAGQVELEASADGYAPARLVVSAPAAEVSIGLVVGSVVAGRVVRQDTLEPVADVTVTASNTDGLRARPASVRTDAGGEFRMPGLPAGTYSIEALAPRWRGEARSIVLDLAAASEHVQLTVVPATPFDARVQAGGKPCASGYVALDGPSHASRSLSADGRVHIDGLLPGPYQATIACVGAEQNPWMDELTIGNEAMSRDWDLLPSEESNRESSKPVASIQAALIAPGSDAAAVTALALGMPGAPLRGTRVGNRIAFERLSLGRYHVYLEQAPHVGQVVELTSDGQVVQVQLDVPPVAEISGRVVDQRGVPVPDTWVRGSNPTTVADAPLLPALTGSQGEFVLRGRLAGPYTLSVESALGRAELAAVSAGARDVLLRLGDRAVAMRACADDTSDCR